MSYCRWSSDNYRSDVYVYESGHGWVTDVCRVKFLIPPIPEPSWRVLSEAYQWSKTRRTRMIASRPLFFLSRIQRALHRWSLKLFIRLDLLHPHGLPFSGKSFLDQTPYLCARRLEWLRCIGYHVPQRAIETLLKEAQDGE